MKTLLTALLVAVFSLQSAAQDIDVSNETQVTDTIKTLKGFWGTTYHQGWRQVNLKQLSKIIEPNEEAYAYIKKARANNTVASIFSFAGGFAIGWSLADIAIKGEVSPGILLAGGAAILVSIPFGISASTNTKKAVERYNHDILHPETAYRKPELQFGFTGSSVGLALRF